MISGRISRTRLVIEANPLQEPRGEGFGHDVGDRDEPFRDFHSTRMLEIERDRTLAAIELGEVGGAVNRAVALGTWPTPAECIGSLRRLDPDHLGPVEGHLHRRVGSDPDPGEIGNPHAFEDVRAETVVTGH